MITTLVNAQPVSVQNGDQLVGPVNIDDTVDSVEFRFERNSPAHPTFWSDPNTKLWFNLYVSYDGGNTWKFEAGTGEKADGGQPMSGGPATGVRTYAFVSVSGMLKQSNRKMEAKVRVEGGPLVSAVTVLAESQD